MKTLSQAVAERGLSVPRPRRFSSKTNRPITYPSAAAVSHRALVEAQAPGFTFSPAVEPGDEVQFSSRGLTDWYVREFERLNSLKRSY